MAKRKFELSVGVYNDFSRNSTQGTLTEFFPEENPIDIASSEEVIDCSESINQHLAVLPVPLGQENQLNALSHTCTSQLKNILRCRHDFNQATTNTMQVVDWEFVFTSTELFGRGFRDVRMRKMPTKMQVTGHEETKSEWWNL